MDISCFLVNPMQKSLEMKKSSIKEILFWTILLEFFIRDLGGVCRHATVKSSKYLMHHVKEPKVHIYVIEFWYLRV